MILCIGNVLSGEELQQIVGQLDKETFVDGKLTAGWHAKLVKNNTQLKSDTESARGAIDSVSRAIARNNVFQMAARPKIVRPPLIARYAPGMSYGSHVDNTIMSGPNGPMRTDISVTLFLNEPSEYAGGELVIEDSRGQQAFKLPAGSMAIYPSTNLHRVEELTEGVRLVAVTWVQSLVRDANDREVLFELDTVRQSLFKQSGKTRDFDILSKAFANLMRKWAEV
ncbi:putative iron-regulated protein [Rubidibacter lacunae KORDI 51-2]|uniref:Putative iron-regulated protein n=1 Tax=Rubidibacter lacunae KORDI 51-2 TaxID=582515 RepID=U5D911_9CHRO|nr:Fe2+-dependent dioxygenase [Rubidibacter lacunae]ERN41078.1 putative iron-regulated protein [Rubidibacter lacunae KORDI 51-2]